MSDYNDNTEQRRLTALIYLITDDRPWRIFFDSMSERSAGLT